METHKETVQKDKDKQRVKPIQTEEVNVIDIETETCTCWWFKSGMPSGEKANERGHASDCNGIVCLFLDLIYVTI